MSSFSERNQSLVRALDDLLGKRIAKMSECRGQITVEIERDHWLDAAWLLRDEPDLGFGQLVDLCGIDYLGYGDDEWETAEATSQGYSRAADALGPGRFSWEERPESAEIRNRFAVVVHLLSHKHNRRLRMRCYAPDDELPVLPSLIEVWNSVNWYEREAFDLYGIVFEGHPDLRRIMTDYGFIGHPFRKDFPLIGNVTVRYDEDKGRVVYVPVEIEPRVTVARVVRRDNRYVEDKLRGADS